MALSDAALITVAEAADELKLTMSSITADLERFERVIALASSEIEQHLNRVLIAPATDYDELHTFPEAGHNLLWTAQRPITSITSVQESRTRDWTVTALVAGNDYVVDYDRGRIERLQSGLAQGFDDSAAWPSGASSFGRINPAWPTGPATVRIKYKAGYTRSTLPVHIVSVCRRLVALKWREVQRGEQGVTGRSDQAGNYTRFGAARLTADMQYELRDDHRLEQSGTASRYV